MKEFEVTYTWEGTLEVEAKNEAQALAKIEYWMNEGSAPWDLFCMSDERTDVDER
tara:strand:- start:48 stop:212 length:165 start_codon:yes stop_codon:yes gene_type:complete